MHGLADLVLVIGSTIVEKVCFRRQRVTGKDGYDKSDSNKVGVQRNGLLDSPDRAVFAETRTRRREQRHTDNFGL